MPAFRRRGGSADHHIDRGDPSGIPVGDRLVRISTGRRVRATGDQSRWDPALMRSSSGSSLRDCRRPRMGTWDVGPFNNDTAADWCGDLHETAGDERLPLVRATLTAVVDNRDTYLANRLADTAIAAAAVVASQLPGGEPLVTPYAPDFLLDGGTLDVPGDIPPLALRALDRIVGDDSEWRDLWEDAGTCADAVGALQTIRATLERAAI
jgi:hypothetical protein